MSNMDWELLHQYIPDHLRDDNNNNNDWVVLAALLATLIIMGIVYYAKAS